MEQGRGRRRLVAAVVAAAALGAVLVAVQLVDEGDGANRNIDTNAPVQVKGAEASRPATLSGTVAGADGWQVEITVLGGDGTTQAAPARNGRYRLTGLPPGPVEVSWTADNTATAGGGVSLGGQRTGRTQITLDPGSNTYDISL